MAKDPAFLLYYKDILVSCADMDADVLGWYTRLLCHQADKPDGLPNDLETLASLAGVKMSQYKRFSICWKHTLEAKFEVNGQGLLENPTQAQGIEHRRSYKNKQQKRGMVGAFIKKLRGKISFDNQQWNELSHNCVEDILTANDPLEIEKTLKRTLVAYATSIIGNGNANGNTIKEELIKENLLQGEPEPEAKSAYSQCVDLYFGFFKSRNDGHPPKFDEKHGKAMKSIIAYLKTVVQEKQKGIRGDAVEVEIVKSFALILAGWDNLSEFSKQQIDLCSMNSQINRIISDLKTVKQNGTKQSKPGTSEARIETASKW
jgi:hypothetical protein